MIREYEDLDFDKLNGNEFIEPELYGDRLLAMLEAYNTYTLVDNGEIIMILSFREYDRGCYSTFLLCSRLFTVKYAKEVRVFIQRGTEALGAKRLETLSLKDDTIDRFHKFLGFTLEGTKRRFFKDRDYNIWSVLYGC